MDSRFLKEKFDQIAEEVILQAETYSFNLSDLPPVNDYQTDIRTESNFSAIFDSLNKKLNSCIYWFEIESEDHCNSLKILLDQNRELLKTNFRTVPAKNKNTCSNVLYVGIRRGGIRKRDKLTNIAGRVAIHLGYYYKGSTQGLQLVHWCSHFDCQVNLKVVEFDNLPNDYLNTIEKITAFKLKPLCGLH